MGLSPPRRHQRCISLVAFFGALFAVPGAAVAAEYHVTPEGTASGDGSEASPWDLATARLGAGGVVAAGDTIWLHAGSYGDGGSEPIDFLMNGQAGNPITVRAAIGERATILGGVTVSGEYIRLWGLEITNPSTDRFVTTGAGEPNARLGGVNLYGRGASAINLVVHNTGHPAIGFWQGPGADTEVYGCIIWGNGVYDPSFNGSPRGNGTYAQNENGTRRIADNISFRNWTEGLDAHSSGQGFVNGMSFEGNIVFDNPVANLSAHTADPANGMQGLRIVDNCTYRRPDENGKATALFGYANDVIHDDVTITGNVFVLGSDDDRALHIKLFQTGVVRDNTWVTHRYFTWWWNGVRGESFDWNDNRYYLAGGTGAPFVLGPSSSLDNGESFLDFDGWRAATGFDSDSSLTMGMPAGVTVCKRPNQYEPDRAHLAVYNWSGASTAEVDLSDLLEPGQGYTIVDAQNYYGAPVAQGVFEGGAVAIPMTQTEVAPILGAYDHWNNAHTAPEFGAFVLTSDAPLTSGSGGAGAGGAGASATGAGGAQSGAVTGSGGGAVDGGEDGGCSCRAGGRARPSHGAWGLLVVALLMRRRRPQPTRV